MLDHNFKKRLNFYKNYELKTTKGRSMSFISHGVGLALTGTARMGALGFSLAATQAVGDIALRGCKKAVNVLSAGNLGVDAPAKKEEDKNYWDKLQDRIQPFIENIVIRPFRDKELSGVIQAAVILFVTGIALTEAVNLLEGSPPPIYNKVLSWLGPIRLYEGFYFPHLAEYSKSLSSKLGAVT